MALLSRGPLNQLLQNNLLSTQIMQAVISEPNQIPTVSAQLAPIAKNDCEKMWQLGVMAGKRGEADLQESYWSKFLSCQYPEALSLTHAGAPANIRLAQQAAQIYPDQAESWYWLGDSLYKARQYPESVEATKLGLQLDPSNGIAWCNLGRMYQKVGSGPAKDAFEQCCNNGDPGSHGCWNAGQLEERAGNIQAAVMYYRKSKWSTALHRADELEKDLSSRP